MTQATSRLRRGVLGIVAGVFAITAIGSTAGLATASATTAHHTHSVKHVVAANRWGN
jgi:hypothetical protein